MIKDFISGFKTGKMYRPAEKKTCVYLKGHRHGIRWRSMTPHDKNILTAQICFAVAITALAVGLYLAFIQFPG
jgi:hypothetical protein